MKKMLKSKLFWIVITILIIGGAVLGRFLITQKSQVEYITQEVKKGSVIQTVSATGKIKSASEIKLNFKNAGKLTVLNAKVGDEVQAGQVLAQLKATDLAINVNRAWADVAEVQANLDKLKAGVTSQDVAVSQTAVEKAETDLLNAQADLENAKATYSQALENEKQNILVDIDSVLTKANIVLQKVYDTLNYEGYSSNFKTSNISLQREVENEYDNSLSLVDEAELAYNITLLDLTDANIDKAVEETLTAILKTSKTVDDLGTLLDYVILTDILPQSELDALKTAINTERTTINTSNTTLQTAKNDLNDARLSYKTKVEAADNDVKVADRNLAKAKADLEYKKAPARPEDVSLYEARVRKAQADLHLAQDKYNETIIKAPITGLITDINFDVGEQTSLSEPMIIMLADENYEIEVDIPESDIVKIGISDEAEITLDAFSDEDIFVGAIITINPAQTEIQDVIYYRVTVACKEEQPENVKALKDKIKPGMTANVTVNTARVDDVLVISLRAVKDKDGKKVVQILENEQPITFEVELGLKGDDGSVEVKSGLSEGQQVITSVREK